MSKEKETATESTEIAKQSSGALEQIQKAASEIGLTNLNPANKNDLAAMFAMETQPAKLIWDEKPDAIEVVAVIVRKAEIENKETGEITDGNRTCFLAKDGTIWLSFSSVLERTATMLAMITCGRGKINPPVKVELQYVKLGPQRTIIQPRIDPKTIERLIGE